MPSGRILVKVIVYGLLLAFAAIMLGWRSFALRRKREQRNERQRRSARLSHYIALIEDFLAGRRAVEEFSDVFFREFQNDPGGWRGGLNESLNGVATACEAYAPDPPWSDFDLTERQLRDECAQHLHELSRLQRDAPSSASDSIDPRK